MTSFIPKSDYITVRIKVNCVKKCKQNIHDTLNNMSHEPSIIIESRESKNITKKKKVLLTNSEKSNLWDIFDQETNSTSKIKNHKPSPTIECIYTDTIDSGLCSTCKSILMIMEDGFPTCTNSTCAIVYRDILDYSPEWRFFGADDKNGNDPTRCGNPINPL
jgi:hypothetical protein